MHWEELDVPTRAGFLAACIAMAGLITPPLAIASAIVAVVFSGVGWRRAHTRGQPNPVAKWVLVASITFIVLIVIGSAIYSALD